MKQELTVEQREQLERGIDAYREQREHLRGLLRTRGQLSQHEFDAEYSDIARDPATGKTTRRAPIFGFSAFKSHTFILAPMQHSSVAKMIHLAQIMAVLGDIEITNENGIVMYRPAKEQ